MKRLAFFSLVFGIAAIAFTAAPDSAEAQLFRRRAQNKVIVNNNGNQPVQVRVEEQRRGGPIRRALGALFGRRQQVTEINIGGQAQFAGVRERVRFRDRSAAVIVNNNVGYGYHASGAFTQHQILARGHFRGQLDQLNTYTTVHNAPANIRHIRGDAVYYNQHTVTAPIVVQRSYSLPPQTVYAPQAIEGQDYTTCDPATADAGVDEADVQYQTQGRSVQRIVRVNRPVAVTGRGVYVTTGPARVQGYTQHDCN